MAAKLTPIVLRLAIPVVVIVLSTAAISFAAAGDTTSARPVAAAPSARPVVRVPDVTGQVFVFAKGMLEDGGFAWRVQGSVGGYAANVVASQYPAAGTRVVDTGMPTVRVTLTPSRTYPQHGDPENTSPYAGSKIVFPTTKPAAPVTKKPVATKPVVKKPVTTKPVTKKPVTKKPVTKTPVTKKPVVKPAQRPAAFAVPGAPKEPLDEITLTARADQLAAWVAAHPTKSDANVHHWLYQHAWIVTGAQFGWFHGREALQKLVQVDDRVIASWGIGSRSRAVAARALREVEAKAR
jgi:hypothetical protein